MARPVRRSRSGAPPSVKDIIQAGPGTVLDGLALVAIGLAAGLGLWLYPASRRWVLETLGYGWIPVGLWLFAALVTLRYQRRTLVQYWRRWAMAAAMVAVAIGTLSLFSTGDGILAESSLGGSWGSLVGGTPLGVAVLKFAGIVLLAPLLFYPRQVGYSYLTALKRIGLGFQYTGAYLYLGGYRVAYFLDRSLRLVLSSRVLGRLFRGMSGSRFRSSSATGGEGPSSVSETDAGEGPDLWADLEPGTLPDWEAPEPVDPGPNAPQKPEPERVGASSDRGSKWLLPPIDLLAPPAHQHPSEAPLEQMARHVEKALAEHGVIVEVQDIRAGPRIVRFGLVPGLLLKKGEEPREESATNRVEATRVKVQSILTREKDLALALKTPYLRIEAPVPGEALVGLEVPSPSPSKVNLREVIETEVFAKISAKGALPIALGQDTGGNPVVVDLAALPHFLIAGATGSGKSVCINSIVVSLLLSRPPDQLRMLMVDPKRVELTPFNGVPHLVAPVIVEVDEVNAALRALMREMMRRYQLMEENGTRNIDGYNAKASERLPYLLLIVDELADLMMSGGFEVEQNLVRLAQLGRATGIHLLLATQRPSVNVVTGLLKANIPARVAFAVASQIDSRVILDTIGAEKLLGKGDMLLLHNESPKPRRVQGTLVYEKEIDQLVEFWRDQRGPPLADIDMSEPAEEAWDEDGMDDQMVDQARQIALRNPRMSSSLLQRRLKIGGRRADQILEELANEGLVIPP